MATAARPKFFRIKDIEILRQAKEACSRDKDTNAIDTESLIEEVQKRISFDPITEHRIKAERLVKICEKPGKTPPEGTLWFPGFDPTDYEPEQLIPDDDGKTVERDLATPHFISASLERAAENLSRVQKAFLHKQIESDEFAIWAADKALEGRPANEITFGNFVREKGFWRGDDD
jgi:hypothetical protein